MASRSGGRPSSGGYPACPRSIQRRRCSSRPSRPRSRSPSEPSPNGGRVFQSEAPLVERRQVGRDLFVLGFAAPEVAAAALPGQFVNLLLRPGPLLRRPFSVYRASDGRVEILLRAVGVGTAQLLGLTAGARGSLLGPLGTGFRRDPAWRSVALVSGGLGVGPFPITARAARAAGLEVSWVHGARSATDLCSEWEGDQAIWATDDGSRGHHG